MTHEIGFYEVDDDFFSDVKGYIMKANGDGSCALTLFLDSDEEAMLIMDVDVNSLGPSQRNDFLKRLTYEGPAFDEYAAIRIAESVKRFVQRWAFKLDGKYIVEVEPRNVSIKSLYSALAGIEKVQGFVK